MDEAMTNVRIAESKFGRGVFAVKSFLVGEPILEVTGARIDVSLLDKQSWASFMERAEPVQVDSFEYIEPELPGRLVNHSCDPNAGLRPDLVLIAIKPIMPGDEIFFDYSTTMDEDYWTMDCLCGVASCRKVIEDFRKLPADTQRKYCEANVVQEFIMRKYPDNLSGP
jgi:SET domain-containing protein